MAAREEREGIVYDNPEKFYEFGDEIGRYVSLVAGVLVKVLN